MKAPGLCNRFPNCARPEGHSSACMSPTALAAHERPIAPADHGNHCGWCGAALPIEAPIHRGPGGSIICAACAEVLTRVAPPTPPPAMVTSVLMRRAAQMLALGSARYLENTEMIEAGIIARELRERAALIQDRALELIDSERRFGTRNPARQEVRELLEEIGEVRS